MKKGLNTSLNANEKPKQFSGFFDNYKALITAMAFLLLSICSEAQIYQNPAVYASADRRRRVDSTLLGPTGCGAPWTLSAVDIAQKHFAQYYDSCNKRFYLYDPKLNAWDTITIGSLSGSGWSLLGNSGTTPPTNFIGTTDDIDFVFKRNSVQAGKIANMNTSFGRGSFNSTATGTLNTGVGVLSLSAVTNGTNNTGTGHSSLQDNTSGLFNSGFGYIALQENTTGSYNTAIGGGALANSVTGSNNIAIGYAAGSRLDGYSNRLIIGNIAKDDVNEDTTQSLVHGIQNANPLYSRIDINSQLRLPYIKPDTVSSDEILGRVSNNGHVTYVTLGSGLTMNNDTLSATGSGPTGSGTTNYVPKWTPDGTTLGNSLIFDDGTNVGIGTATPGGGLQVGNGTVNTSTDPAILANRILNSGSGNSHGVSDATNFSRSGTVAYASFDARATISGSSNFDHYAGFQAAPIFSGSGTISNIYGVYSLPTVSGGGIVTNSSGFYVANQPSITGTITNNYGLYIESLTRGSNNYAIYTSGSAASIFGGSVTAAGLLSANAVGGNIRIKADGTTAKDAGIFANAGGDIYFSNWDANRGLYIKSTGEVNILSALTTINGLTSSFPAFRRNAALFELRLADNSARTGLLASTIEASNSVTSPLLIGGSATTSPLTYRTTSGVGTTGADHIFQVGNNGATEAMRILNNGSVGIGTTSPTAKLHVTQTAPASVATTTVTAQSNPLTILGSAGGATSSNGAVVTAGNSGSVAITTGNGGAITGAPTTGFGGNAGEIRLLGGDGGTGTTFGGNGGNVEMQAGNAGNGTTQGAAGYASLKGGNAFASGNGSGGSIYVVGGIKNGTGQDGSIFLGVSPSLTVRGNTVIGSSTDDYTNKLQVTGNSKFDGTVILKSYTVGTLPTGVAGAICYVTDATAPTWGATLVGGGAVVTMAFYDGTNWTAR